MSYADFFTEAAVRYYAKTGKKVAVISGYH